MTHRVAKGTKGDEKKRRDVTRIPIEGTTFEDDLKRGPNRRQPDPNREIQLRSKDRDSNQIQRPSPMVPRNERLEQRT